MSNDNTIISKRVGRGVNKKIYHYQIENLNDNKIEYYKTIKDITAKHGISRCSVYLMIKNQDEEIQRRKYAHLIITKIRSHYLTIEQGIDPSSIIL
jgi:ribosome-binding factor A